VNQEILKIKKNDLSREGGMVPNGNRL